MPPLHSPPAGGAHRSRPKTPTRLAYRAADFDLILSSDDNALAFLLKYGDRLYPRAKKVFRGVNSIPLAQTAYARGITGVLDVKNIAGTLEAALDPCPFPGTWP